MIKGIVGIECGGKNSILSKIGRSGLETIQSESSSREIPCAVVFKETQRIFAEVAQDRIKAYYQQSLTYLFRLCASEEINRGYCSFQVSPETNKPIIQNEQFDFEQLVASFLTYLDFLIKNHLPANDSYVCAVSAPNYFTLEDKLRLQVACRIARLPCLEVVSEHVAVGYNYLWFSKKDLVETTKRVLFIDFGDSQSNCFVYQFENHIGTLENLAVCRDLGVRDIDQGIYCFLQNKYPQIMQNISKKSELRVREQIARTRKELSSNTESQFIVESVSGDNDLQHLFTREQLLKIVEENGLLNKLRELVGQIGSIEGITEIELLGGGSRIPIVQQTIKEVLKIDKLGVTFQSCETVSRGCAIACAVAAKSLNPLIKIEPYSIKSKLQENMSVELVVSGEVRQKKVYKKGQETPVRGSLSVILKENENAGQVNVRFKEINQSEMEIIEKEMKNNEEKEKVVEPNGMDIEGETDNKINQILKENEMVIEEQNKTGDASENGDTANATTDTPAASQSSPEGIRVLVEYYVSESGIGGIRDGRQLVGSTGWQHIDVESESTVPEEKLIAMQVREKEFKDRDASVRQVLEERNTLEAYLNSKIRYIKETLQFKISEDLCKEVETQLQVIEEEYLSIQDHITSEQIQEMLKRAHAAMNQIEVTLTNDKKITFSANSITDVEGFVKGFKKTQKIKVDEFELKISGQGIGDGKGIFGMFKKSGAQKLKQALECLQVAQSLNLQLGDNSLNASGLSEILNGIDMQEIQEINLELDSAAAGKKNQNKITDKELVQILQELLTRVGQLTLLSLTLNSPSKDLLVLLDILPSTLTSLKHLNLTLTNFAHDHEAKKLLENGLLSRSHTLTLNCITPNGTLFH